MAAAYPSGTNTFVPSFDATGQLVVAYSRNPKDFPLNKYTTIIPVKRSIGYYLKLTAENAARIVGNSVQDAVWHDGNDAPSGEWNTESHNFVNYLTLRYAFAFRLGYKAIQQADWKVLATHAANSAQQAMTGRALNVITTMTTTSNWAASHVSATATALAGGNFGAGTASNPIIKKGFNLMAQKIQKDTLGVVRPRDLVFVISPTSADLMGRSAEVHQYLQQSPFALAQVRGDAPNQNGLWGLPDALYGIPIVVEDTVRTSTRKGTNTQTIGYMLGNQGIMVARPGQLVAEGSSAFSTLGIFMFEEMTVESRDDPDNRRQSGRVVEDYTVQVLSDISGYLVSDVTS